MADETTATLEQPQTTEGGLPVDQQFDVGKAEDAAEQFLAATRAELENETPPTESKPTPARGPDGKFLRKEAPAEPQASPADEQPAVDPVWKELAKSEGLPDDAIEAFKSEAEIEAAIQTQRVQKYQQAAQLLGLDAQNYQQYVQWKQGQGAAQNGQQPPAQTTQTQTTPPAVIEELKLDLDEDELDPKVLATIKALTAQVNKLTPVAAENQKLGQKLAELEGALRQSALQAQATQQQAVYAESWDKAATKIPGFTEYFGKPSELLRLAQTQPNHQRIRDYIGFDAHFQPIWQQYASRVGENDTALYLAIRDAWSASPYSKLARNGTTNGSAQQPTNGVVRQTARRTGPQEPMTKGADIDAEMNRSMATLAGEWERKGENPFKALGYE